MHIYRFGLLVVVGTHILLVLIVVNVTSNVLPLISIVPPVLTDRFFIVSISIIVPPIVPSIIIIIIGTSSIVTAYSIVVSVLLFPLFLLLSLLMIHYYMYSVKVCMSKNMEPDNT